MDEIKSFYKRYKITAIFLVIMVIYFIFISLNGGTTNTISLVKHGAFFPPFVTEFNQYYRFITSIFIHIGIVHLLFNGYALYILGPQIEGLMGSKKYLLFFLLTGIAGNVATYFFNYQSVSAGASGSIFGFFGVFLYLIHRHKEMITTQVRNDILRLVLINLVLTFTISNISTTAHVGGLVAGYLLSYIFVK